MARVAYNQADDNAADRLLALQVQVGLASTMVSDSGVVLSRRIASEIIDIDVGLNVFGDGQTYGGSDRRITSASMPFTAAMVGLPITIYGHGRRFIEAFNGYGDVEYSGPVIAAQSGLRFTQPLGLVSFEDGQIDGNTLTSSSAPFYPQLVGRNVSVHELGTREVVSYASASEIELDGAASVLMQGLRFTLPVVMEQADRLLKSGSQVIDAHRSPPLTVPTIMRWRLGERRRRGAQRTVV